MSKIDNKVYTPKYVAGYNTSIAFIFGFGPKFTVVCGKCSVSFKVRVHAVNYPVVSCPACFAANRLPLEIE